MIHGFAQCSDVYIEGAFQYTLNGFIVHLVDLEGYGFSSGTRVSGMNIENFHHQITAVLKEASDDLPCFLFGHSMGGLAVSSYLGLNPGIAAKLAGIIYSAPFLGFPDHNAPDFGKRAILALLSPVMDEFVLVGAMPI